MTVDLGAKRSMSPIFPTLKGWVSSVLIPLSVTSITLVAGGAIAQPLNSALAQAPPGSPQPISIQTCQPPASGEYILIAVTRTPESQTQVQQILPPGASSAVCTYLNDTVTRVGGFRTLDRANAWARYITETTGWAAYVARPFGSTASSSADPQGSPTPQPQSAQPTPDSTSSRSPAYHPKPLGVGYAVLVDYANQPEMAVRVQQALGTDIGLAAYSQRPYLLALYTTDAGAAQTILQTLSDRGFFATLVDSRRVVLLKSAISVPRPSSP